ncbi:hypothetical protein [Denitromonas iodatirespirans]|uniref:Uncharacterized protein n=1 Tax=Denitromonas iodatirespirans TaxID=2795389 RepID=A0A944D8U3_DENI1|nr:hypothetical protein [Denitromonas iodatirespirans]MBT0960471.1 hypothetical protein [Denitromonas iodatirespirans]
MKSVQAIALCLGLMVSVPALAHGGPYMGGASSAIEPAQAVEKLKENATRLQAQVARIAEAGNDEARGKAVAEYMQSLGEGMMLARALDPHGVNCPMGWGGMGMMGYGMMGPGMMGCGGGGADEAARLQAIEARMGMMQMMMQHMMGGQPLPPAK